MSIKKLQRNSNNSKFKGFTQDSFTNFMNKVGMGTDNPLSYSTYSLNNLISRNRVLLEAGYRSSWLIGQAVDVIAEDMTKMGIEMISKMSPDNIKKLQVALVDYSVWESLCNIIKWARLYGGCLGLILINGAKYDKPLNLDRIGKNTFQGILVLDRWMCEPILGKLITDLNKDFGNPEYYKIHTSVGGTKLPGIDIHYSRVMRFDGITLPYYQKFYENYWGLSVIERIYDRLLSYDSGTMGASQLLYKAFLRIVGIDGLREALANGGREEAAVIKQWKYIRQMQTNEGITLLDSKDTFDIRTNSFSGIKDLLDQFGEQVSGAIGIPLVRLFGQSPAGFQTGDMDLRNYYDTISRQQENKLRPELTKLLEIISMSTTGKRLPEDFEFKFLPLWQMSDTEKAALALSDSQMIRENYGAELISKELAIKELQQLSRLTGRFTNITQDDIDKAKEDDLNKPPSGMFGIPPKGVEENNPLGAGFEKESKETETSEESREKENKEIIQGAESSISEKAKESQRDADAKVINIDFKPIRDKMKKDRERISKKYFSTTDEGFVESEHPRGKGEKGGQFVKKGEGGSSGSSKKSGEESKVKKLPRANKEQEGEVPKRTKSTVSFNETKRDKDGNLTQSSGKKLPVHIDKLYIAPAWKNVIYNPDPKGDLQVVGYDNGGRKYLYSEEHNARVTKAQDKMIQLLNKSYKSIMGQLETSLKKGDVVEKENAFITKLLDHTGIRIGSKEELLGSVKTYGAITLEARHILPLSDGSVKLEFVGKHGKDNTYIITDKFLAKVLTKLKMKKKSGERLFQTDYDEHYLPYVKSLDGGDFTPKDFRTKVGTDAAIEKIKGVTPPTTLKEYKKAVKTVAKYVAGKLNNTRGQALKYYIVPSVWKEWKKSAGVK